MTTCTQRHVLAADPVDLIQAPPCATGLSHPQVAQRAGRQPEGEPAAGQGAAPKYKRPYFRKKSDWCAWEAEQCRAAMKELTSDYVESQDWRSIQRKGEIQSRYLGNESYWLKRAADYRVRGD